MESACWIELSSEAPTTSRSNWFQTAKINWSFVVVMSVFYRITRLTGLLLLLDLLDQSQSVVAGDEWHVFVSAEILEQLEELTRI